MIARENDNNNDMSFQATRSERGCGLWGSGVEGAPGKITLGETGRPDKCSGVAEAGEGTGVEKAGEHGEILLYCYIEWVWGRKQGRGIVGDQRCVLLCW